MSDSRFTSDATSLSEVLQALEADGFTAQMAARPEGRIICFVCRTESDACDVGLSCLRRTEGASDPADMLAVAALTCPHCGAKGTAVLNFGPESSEDDAEVLHRLDDQRPGH